MSSRAESIEKTETKNTRTASCTNASLPRVKESQWQQQTGADGRSVRPRRRETSSRQTREQDSSTKVKKGEIKSSLIPRTRGKTTRRPQWTTPGKFRHFAICCNEGRSCLMERTTCNCRHNREVLNTKEKQRKFLTVSSRSLHKTW